MCALRHRFSGRRSTPGTDHRRATIAVATSRVVAAATRRGLHAAGLLPVPWSCPASLSELQRVVLPRSCGQERPVRAMQSIVAVGSRDSLRGGDHFGRAHAGGIVSKLMVTE